MQLGQLEAFLSVVRRGKIAKAAHELYLAQSSVVARIEALERELGVKLMVRTRRGAVLTDAGRSFLPFARAAFEALEEGRRALEGVRRGHSTIFRVGTVQSIATYLLPRVLSKFTARHPDVTMMIETGTSADIQERVARGITGVGVIRRVSRPDLQAVPLCADELVLVVSPRHRLAQRGRVHVAELAGLPLIAHGPESSHYELTYSFLKALDLTPRYAYFTDNVETTKELIRLDMGVAFLPRLVVGRERDPPGRVSTG